MLDTIVTTVINLIHEVWGFFLNIAPHNFGVIAVPLIILGVMSLWAARRPQARG
jgi:hypothetical protein